MRWFRSGNIEIDDRRADRRASPRRSIRRSLSRAWRECRDRSTSREPLLLHELRRNARGFRRARRFRLLFRRRSRDRIFEARTNDDREPTSRNGRTWLHARRSIDHDAAGYDLALRERLLEQAAVSARALGRSNAATAVHAAAYDRAGPPHSLDGQSCLHIARPWDQR